MDDTCQKPKPVLEQEKEKGHKISGALNGLTTAFFRPKNPFLSLSLCDAWWDYAKRAVSISLLFVIPTHLDKNNKTWENFKCICFVPPSKRMCSLKEVLLPITESYLGCRSNRFSPVSKSPWSQWAELERSSSGLPPGFSSFCHPQNESK